jgi:hypothetical protein
VNPHVYRPCPNFVCKFPRPYYNNAKGDFRSREPEGKGHLQIQTALGTDKNPKTTGMRFPRLASPNTSPLHDTMIFWKQMGS